MRRFKERAGGSWRAVRSRVAISALFGLAFVLSVEVVRGQAQEHIGAFSQADIIKGAQLYTGRCAVCHGLEGAAVPNIDFRRGQFRTAVTDDDIKRIVRTGVPAAGMPPFALDDESLRAIIAYIRSGMDASRPAMPIPVGDAGRGKAIFEGPKGECLSCHRVAAQGARSAPDLSDIGVGRTPTGLINTLLNPTTAMFPINRPVRAVSAQGKTITGRRLNEDTYTVSISQEDGSIVTLDKASLKSFSVSKTSPMPSYAARLTAQELGDVLAYLLTLKTPKPGVLGAAQTSAVPAQSVSGARGQ